MLCVARRVGAGFCPGTTRWEITHCTAARDLVGRVYNVRRDDEPEGLDVAVFDFEPEDQFLRAGRALDSLLS